MPGLGTDHLESCFFKEESLAGIGRRPEWNSVNGKVGKVLMVENRANI